MKPGIKWTLIGGSLAFLGAPAVGFLVTALGMLTAFDNLARRGSVGPEVVGGYISTALTATVIGFVISTFGFIAIVIALILHFTSPRQKNGDGTNPAVRSF